MERIDAKDETGRGHAPPGFACPGFSCDADVVLLHGFMGRPWTMRPMERALRGHGFRTCCPWYESWATPFDSIVERIHARLERQRIGRERPVHFVAHSMGGLVARLVADRLPLAAMGHMVMIGTPNAGSELADFCTRHPMLRPILGRAGPALVTRRALLSLDGLGKPTYPVGIIAGDRALPIPLRLMPRPHDGRVSVASTHLAGQADHIILPVAHAAMPFNRAVQQQAAHFLTTGTFRR